MDKAHSKTDASFLLFILEEKTLNLTKSILSQLNTLMFTVGSKGKPSILDLSDGLANAQSTLEKIAELKEKAKLPSVDQAELFDQVKELSAQITEIDESCVNVRTRSKSYGFYTEKDINELTEFDKKVEALKNSNIHDIERALQLKCTDDVKAFIDSCIKINKSLAILPYSRDEAGAPEAGALEILDRIEKLVGLNKKTLDQITFRQLPHKIIKDNLSEAKEKTPEVESADEEAKEKE